MVTLLFLGCQHAWDRGEGAEGASGDERECVQVFHRDLAVCYCPSFRMPRHGHTAVNFNDRTYVIS